MFIAGVARPVPAAEAALGARLAAYLELTKPRVNALVVAVAAAGFWMGAPGIPDRARFAYTLLGVALLGAGMFTLNQCFEAVPDSRMRRTASRPVPSERLRPSQALWFGWTLAAAGLAVLLAGTNPASAIIGTLTLTSYLFIYTPLKLRTPHCTLVGAFPGAAPPLLGWVAARGYVSVEALWLFAILWLWQFPHFHSIALLHREDYARAGFRLWTVVEPEDTTIGRQIVAFTAILLGVSLLPAIAGGAGAAYGVGAAAAGLAFLYVAGRTAVLRTRGEAQRLLLGSVVYLPVLLLMMVLAK